MNCQPCQPGTPDCLPCGHTEGCCGPVPCGPLPYGPLPDCKPAFACQLNEDPRNSIQRCVDNMYGTNLSPDDYHKAYEGVRQGWPDPLHPENMHDEVPGRGDCQFGADAYFADPEIRSEYYREDKLKKHCGREEHGRCLDDEILQPEKTKLVSKAVMPHSPSLPERDGLDSFPNLKERIGEKAQRGYAAYLREQEVNRRAQGIGNHVPREVLASPTLPKEKLVAIREDLVGKETHHTNEPQPSSHERQVVSVEDLGKIPKPLAEGEERVKGDPRSIQDSGNPAVRADMATCKNDMRVAALAGAISGGVAGASASPQACAGVAKLNPAAGAACVGILVAAGASAGAIGGASAAKESEACQRLLEPRPSHKIDTEEGDDK